MKRIGIFGGTFSPPHIGHLFMARTAVEQLRLDELMVIPCGDPPHKKLVWNAKLRFEMTKALFCGEDRIFVSDMEIKEQGKSYTAKTLSLLKENNKEKRLFFIVGADSLCYMDDWKNPEIIFKNAEIAVIGREGFETEEIFAYAKLLNNKYNAKIHFLSMERCNVSSSMLRQMLEENLDISKYTGDKVYNILLEQKNGLW